MFSALVAALAAALAGGEPACPKPPRGQPAAVSTNPNWLAKPSPEDVYWAYPPKAVNEEVKGRARISCEVSEQGKLEACSVTEEEPKGYGFGEAALSLTSKMLFTPATRCGAPARGSVTLPITFALPEEPPAPSTAPLDPADEKLALAARLIAAFKTSDALREGADAHVVGLINLAEEEREVTAEERKAIHEAAREAWAGGQAKVLNAMARSYASRMSREELIAALAFYESPVGAKMVEAQALLMLDLERVLEAVQPEIELEFEKRYCERMQSLCAPPDAV